MQKYLAIGILCLGVTACRESMRFSTIPDAKDLRELRTEEFIQTQSGKYDLLWVVDNSGSMGDEQTTLKNEFNDFVSTLNQRQAINYQMAVTTTDMTNGGTQGQLVLNKVISSQMTNPESEFASVINAIGISGSGDERGLAASLVELSKTNSSLRRPGVPFVLIYVSDENDGSALGTENQILSRLQNLRSPVFVFSIVSPQDNCNLSNNVYGERYVSLAQGLADRGKVLNICPSDLASSFQEVASSLSEASYIFSLKQIPADGAVSVYINGIRLQDSSDRYYYDPSRNAIVFRRGFEPSLNERITVKYLY